MEIILLKDIPKLGKRYDLKNVRDGYGRNFLLPQKLAMLAEKTSIKSLELLRKAEEVKKGKKEKEIKDSLFALQDKEFTVSAKANEDGELFGGISANLISEELKRQGYNIPEDFIKLPEHIKHIGEYEISLEAKDIKNKFKLKVIKE